VCTKDSCWSVGTIYDPRELPVVSIVGPGIGQGITLARATTNLVSARASRSTPLACTSLREDSSMRSQRRSTSTR
jgi:hypothetical protein